MKENELENELRNLFELEKESSPKKWILSSYKNPTKDGYYIVLRNGSKPSSIHDAHPAVHYWYNDKQEWSSQTNYWLSDVE